MKTLSTKKRYLQLRGLVAANVRRLRNKAGWTQAEFEKLSGLHRTHISLIERGILNPTLLALVKLATALRVPVAALWRPLPASSSPDLRWQRSKKAGRKK